MREWQPLHTAFAMEWQEVMHQLLPTIEVHSARSKNEPSPGDPLGARPKITVEWHSAPTLDGEPRIRLAVGGDTNMPFLEPQAAAAYLLVQWPELFRRRP